MSFQNKHRCGVRGSRQESGWGVGEAEGECDATSLENAPHRGVLHSRLGCLRQLCW